MVKLSQRKRLQRTIRLRSLMLNSRRQNHWGRPSEFDPRTQCAGHRHTPGAATDCTEPLSATRDFSPREPWCTPPPHAVHHPERTVPGNMHRQALCSAKQRFKTNSNLVFPRFWPRFGVQTLFKQLIWKFVNLKIYKSVFALKTDLLQLLLTQKQLLSCNVSQQKFVFDISKAFGDGNRLLFKVVYPPGGGVGRSGRGGGGVTPDFKESWMGSTKMRFRGVKASIRYLGGMR